MCLKASRQLLVHVLFDQLQRPVAGALNHHLHVVLSGDLRAQFFIKGSVAQGRQESYPPDRLNVAPPKKMKRAAPFICLRSQPMKLHILSDLHLSVAGFEVPQTDADVIILAGDIARPKEAVAWARTLTKPVLYVPGNHEFYGSSLASTVMAMKQLCRGSGIQLLDNNAVVMDGVRFVGSTLWTDFQLFGEGEKRDEAVSQALSFIRDFSRICMDDLSGALFTPDLSAVEFTRHANWLKAQLAEPFVGKTVVITHHAPSPKSIHPRFEGSPFNACFVSDAERLIDGKQVALWIHGHTHDSFDYVVNGTRVVCNPRGYAKNGVNENPQFDPALVIEVV